MKHINYDLRKIRRANAHTTCHNLVFNLRLIHDIINFKMSIKQKSIHHEWGYGTK